MCAVHPQFWRHQPPLAICTNHNALVDVHAGTIFAIWWGSNYFSFHPVVSSHSTRSCRQSVLGIFDSTSAKREALHLLPSISFCCFALQSIKRLFYETNVASMRLLAHPVTYIRMFRLKWAHDDSEIIPPLERKPPARSITV